MTEKRRRPRGEGGLTQRHDHKDCPPLEQLFDVNGLPVLTKTGKPKMARPKHKCSGTWTATIDRGYVGGQRKIVTLYAGTKTEALAKMRKKKNEIAKHGEAAARTGGATLGQWLEQWLVDVAAQRYKPKTLTTNKYLIRAHIVPAIGHIRLDKLEPPDVVKMERDVEKKTKLVDGEPVQLSTATSLRCHRVLAKALTDAMRWGLVTRNVTDFMDAPNLPVSNRGALTLAEAKKVLDHNSRSGDRLMSRWFMALTHGIRQGEALGLRWPYVDLESGTLEIAWELQRVPFRHGCGDQTEDGWPCGLKRPGSCPERQLDVRRGFEHEQLDGGLCLLRPKSKAGSRMVALQPWAVAPLQERFKLYRAERGTYAQDHGLVWPHSTGRPVDLRDDSRAWHDLLDKTGVRDVELHAARHSAATLLHEAGVGEHVVQAILGHSSAIVTRGYQHISLDEQRKALTKLGKALELDR